MTFEMNFLLCQLPVKSKSRPFGRLNTCWFMQLIGFYQLLGLYPFPLRTGSIDPAIIHTGAKAMRCIGNAVRAGRLLPPENGANFPSRKVIQLDCYMGCLREGVGDLHRFVDGIGVGAHRKGSKTCFLRILTRCHTGHETCFVPFATTQFSSFV